MSDAMAIQNLEGEHIGFVLTHFETDTALTGKHNGECVFMALPKKAELMNHPLTDRMYEHKFAGEHSCMLNVSDSHEEYSITKDGVMPLRIVVGDNDGQLFDVRTNSQIGKVVRAKAKG